MRQLAKKKKKVGVLPTIWGKKINSTAIKMLEFSPHIIRKILQILFLTNVMLGLYISSSTFVAAG